MTDFPSWFDRVVDFWKLKLDKETRYHFLRSVDFTVEKEGVHSHKRQVTPGDHLRKLQLETIEKLNKIYGDILVALDYDTSSPSKPMAA